MDRMAAQHGDRMGLIADIRKHWVLLAVLLIVVLLSGLPWHLTSCQECKTPAADQAARGENAAKLKILDPQNARILEMADRIFFPPPGHYTEEYWKFQRNMHIFGSKANAMQYRDYAKPDMNCLEFGASAGYYLEAMNCRAKMGVELNPFPRQEALSRNVSVVPYLDDVPDEWADLVFSSHVLEHVPCPLCELERIRLKMKAGSLLVLWIPHDHVNSGYSTKDKNHHLQTWNEQLIGNLAQDAGFEVVEAKAVPRAWPHYSETKLLREGLDIFDAAAENKGKHENRFEVNLVARKPK